MIMENSIASKMVESFPVASTSAIVLSDNIVVTRRYFIFLYKYIYNHYMCVYLLMIVYAQL